MFYSRYTVSFVAYLSTPVLISGLQKMAQIYICLFTLDLDIRGRVLIRCRESLFSME